MVPMEATSRIRWRTEVKESRSDKVSVTGEGVVTVSGSKIEAAKTFLELPLAVTATYELRIAEEESILYIEASEGGKVLGLGAGDNREDALLDMILYLLPRDHPEYPELPDH